MLLRSILLEEFPILNRVLGTHSDRKGVKFPIAGGRTPTMEASERVLFNSRGQRQNHDKAKMRDKLPNTRSISLCKGSDQSVRYCTNRPIIRMTIPPPSSSSSLRHSTPPHFVLAPSSEHGDGSTLLYHPGRFTSRLGVCDQFWARTLNASTATNNP